MESKINNTFELSDKYKLKLLLLEVYDEIAEEINYISENIRFESYNNETIIELLKKIRNLYFLLNEKDRYTKINSEIYWEMNKNNKLSLTFRKMELYTDKSSFSSTDIVRLDPKMTENEIKIECFLYTSLFNEIVKFIDTQKKIFLLNSGQSISARMIVYSKILNNEFIFINNYINSSFL